MGRGQRCGPGREVDEEPAGLRTLRLPRWLVDVLGRRRPSSAGASPVFPDSVDVSWIGNNVERDFRQVKVGTPFEWVAPHTYRKTVATFLDHGGLSARVVAWRPLPASPELVITAL